MCSSDLYVEQYQWLFQQDQVDLEFSKSALQQIAENTIKNKTGARGLHSELERVLMPHMFNLVGYKQIAINRVEIDQDLVNNPVALKESDAEVARKVSNGH